MTKSEAPGLVLGVSDFFRHSQFGIRHSGRPYLVSKTPLKNQPSSSLVKKEPEGPR